MTRERLIYCRYIPNLDGQREDEDDINANAPDGGDVEDDNTLHLWEARKKGNEESEEESLFFKDRDDDHYDYDSESSDKRSEKKKK